LVNKRVWIGVVDQMKHVPYFSDSGRCNSREDIRADLSSGGRLRTVERMESTEGLSPRGSWTSSCMLESLSEMLRVSSEPPE